MLTNSKGILIAFDKNKEKTARLHQTLQRLSVENAYVRTMDATHCVSPTGVSVSEFIKNTESTHLYPEQFDRVLLDPPCSGLGQRPILQQSSYECFTIEGLPAYQKILFASAVSLLKPGG